MAADIPGLSDLYALLSGPTFTLSFAVMGVFWGIAAQRLDKKLLLTLACIIWSLSTVGISLTHSVVIVGAMRILLGAF